MDKWRRELLSLPDVEGVVLASSAGFVTSSLLWRGSLHSGAFFRLKKTKMVNYLYVEH